MDRALRPGGAGKLGIGDRKRPQGAATGPVIDGPIEPGGRRPDSAAQHTIQLLPDLVGRRAEFSQRIATDDVQVAVLARTHCKMLHRAARVRLIRKQHDPAGAQIHVSRGIRHAVRQGEVIGHRQHATRRGNLHKRIPIIPSGGKAAGVQGGLERAIGRQQIHIAC